jgi:GNAT superfamily N-acetyltransferase
VTERVAAAAAPVVRPAVLADAPDIARAHVEAWQSAYVGLVPQKTLDDLSIERRAAYWSRRLAEPGADRTWVAEHDGRIVGFVGTGRPNDPEIPPDTAEVQAIYLVSSVRGRGLGRLLIETAVGDLVERDFSEAILWVFTANDRARHFYEAAGWRPDGTAQMLDFDGHRIEEIRYRMDLRGTPLNST